jgi:hypothetical protein
VQQFVEFFVRSNSNPLPFEIFEFFHQLLLPILGYGTVPHGEKDIVFLLDMMGQKGDIAPGILNELGWRIPSSAIALALSSRSSKTCGPSSTPQPIQASHFTGLFQVVPLKVRDSIPEPEPSAPARRRTGGAGPSRFPRPIG